MVEKLVRGGRVFAPSPEVGSERGVSAPLAEAVGGGVFAPATAEGEEPEGQQGKFFYHPRVINRIR